MNLLAHAIEESRNCLALGRSGTKCSDLMSFGLKISHPLLTPMSLSSPLEWLHSQTGSVSMMGRTASLGSSISRAHRLHERENFLVPASRPGHFPQESYRPCLQRLPILQLLHPKAWSTVIGQPRAWWLPWQTSQNHVLTGRKVTSTKKEDGMDLKKRYDYNCEFVSLRDSVDLYLRAWGLCAMRQDWGLIRMLLFPVLKSHQSLWPLSCLWATDYLGWAE